MPELPEVETTVRGLKREVKGKRIVEIWTDFEKMVKKPASFSIFKKELKGRKIKDIKRRGKNILLLLDKNKVLLFHQKMTGHLIVGKWIFKNKEWVSLKKGPLKTDLKNRFIHFLLFLDDKSQVAMSDMRKFAKAELWNKDELEKDFLNSLGPEPLKEIFTLEVFRKVLNRKKKSKIKQVLMDQSVVAGIGNIYSDEILWEARVGPFRKTDSLNKKELNNVFKAIKKILKKGIKTKGDSFSDYRKVDGTKGTFDLHTKVYSKEGEKCSRCKSFIKRKKIGGRSAHYCPNCQK